MGRLTYDSSNVIEFDDRLLTHLQVVIGRKIRVRQSFYFSWKNDPKAGDGRCTIWINPRMALHFTYTTSRVPPLNREWLDLLTASANSPDGLKLIAEPRPDGEHTGTAPTGVVSTAVGAARI
jgi:hypothetical protein